MADKKQSAWEIVRDFQVDLCEHRTERFRKHRDKRDCSYCTQEMLESYATQERAEQKRTDAETVRGIKQMRVHEMLRGLDNPFLDAKSEPDKDGWTNLSKGVLQILARAATAIVKKAK